MARDWKNSTLAERLEHVLKVMEWSPAEMGRAIGTPHDSTVSNWINRNRRMDYHYAFVLQDKYGWNARWLLEAVGRERVAEPERAEILGSLEVLPIERLRAIKAALGS